jgi:hypothetical protein
MATNMMDLVSLQAEAWELCNASYYVDDGEIYRAAGVALYDRAIRHQVETLFARSDEQNARLDALLAAQKGTAAPKRRASHGNPGVVSATR